MISRAIFSIIASVVLLANGGATAQTIKCDEFYEVRRGDTLQKIADSAYGRGSAYQIIYSANREEIGRNPGNIKVDAELWIPCVGQNEHKTVERIVRPEGRDVELVTGSDYAPFTDKALKNGGLFTELVDRSIQVSDPALKYRVDFVDDWSSHLRVLLAGGKYDMGFPWYKPDCSKYDLLGKESQWRCDNLRFSDPFYETVVGYFGRADRNEKYTNPAQLHGKTLCRPNGYFKFDLEVRKLVAPNATLLQPQSIKECFDKLLSGEVDIVTVGVLVADAVIKQQGLKDKIVEYEDLATIETLHVVVLKTHPRARPLLLRVNRGLKRLQENGDYRDLVQARLAEFMQD